MAPTYASASALYKEPGATECIAHGHLAHQNDARLFDPLAQYDSVSPGCSCWPSDPENECYDRCIESGSCGAVCDGRPAFGTWSEMEKSWHINCQELRAVHLVFECFLPDILHHHVLIRTDSMTVEAYINHQGGVNSVCVNIYETYSLICKAWWRWCHGIGMHGCLWNSPSQLYWWLNV